MSVAEHCVLMGIGDMEIYTCLTCKKGTIHAGVGRIGDRWTEMHSKQKECREAHPAAYARFKALWKASRESVAVAEKEAMASAIAKAEAAVAVSAAGGVGELWTKCRREKHLTAYLTEIEEKLRVLHSLDVDDDEDPAPYVFDPADAFLTAIAGVMSLDKEVKLSKQKISEMVVAHDAELTVHRAELLRIGRESAGWKTHCLRAEKELTACRGEFTTLSTEHNKLSEEHTQLIEEHTKLSGIVVSHNAELISQRAELVKIGQESARLNEVSHMISEELREYRKENAELSKKLKIQEETVKTHDQKMKELQAELDALKAKCSVAGIV